MSDQAASNLDLLTHTSNDGEAKALELALLGDDLSKLSPQQRLFFYTRTCQSLGLNPLTKPFSYLELGGRLTLYAKKDCTDQLRKIHGVSITGIEPRMVDGETYVVTANGRDRDGRVDASTGAVYVGVSKGEARANLMMKAETKAKRRLTLSLCGLGMLDETEADDIPGGIQKDTEVMHAAPVADPKPPYTAPASDPDNGSESLMPALSESVRKASIAKIEKYTDAKIKIVLHRVLSVDPESDWRKFDVAALDTIARHLEKK